MPLDQLHLFGQALITADERVFANIGRPTDDVFDPWQDARQIAAEIAEGQENIAKAGERVGQAAGRYVEGHGQALDAFAHLLIVRLRKQVQQRLDIAGGATFIAVKIGQKGPGEVTHIRQQLVLFGIRKLKHLLVGDGDFQVAEANPQGVDIKAFQLR